MENRDTFLAAGGENLRVLDGRTRRMSRDRARHQPRDPSMTGSDVLVATMHCELDHVRQRTRAAFLAVGLFSLAICSILTMSIFCAMLG